MLLIFQSCANGRAVVEKIRTYFDMDIQATRFNWYRDSSDWKPYHHDAAAMKAHMATKQNITIAASFGAERDVSFMASCSSVSVLLVRLARSFAASSCFVVPVLPLDVARKD